MLIIMYDFTLDYLAKSYFRDMWNFVDSIFLVVVLRNHNFYIVTAYYVLNGGTK